jgi:hypothetical protein
MAEASELSIGIARVKQDFLRNASKFLSDAN